MLPYRAIAPEVDAALIVLESSATVDQVADAYTTVNAEAGRRAKNVFTFCLLVGGTVAILIGAGHYLQLLPYPNFWGYALAPIGAVTLGSIVLRSDTANDDARVHRAVVKWRKQLKSSRP